jgi:hypothetical protein
MRNFIKFFLSVKKAGSQIGPKWADILFHNPSYKHVIQNFTEMRQNLDKLNNVMWQILRPHCLLILLIPIKINYSYKSSRLINIWNFWIILHYFVTWFQKNCPIRTCILIKIRCSEVSCSRGGEDVFCDVALLPVYQTTRHYILQDSNLKCFDNVAIYMKVQALFEWKFACTWRC